MVVRKETILLIEDDINDRTLMTRAFQAGGSPSSLQLLADSQDLISYMNREGKYSDRIKFPRPALIITDLNSTNLDGFNTLSHLKRDPEWSSIPVVVLSGSDNPLHIKNAMALGADSYFVKPLDFQNLRSLLQTLQTRFLKQDPITASDTRPPSSNDFRSDQTG